MATKAAPIGLKQPMDGSFDAVSSADNSIIDRLAVGTAWRKQPHCGANRHLESAFAVTSAAELE
jgi:hypothetical protein